MGADNIIYTEENVITDTEDNFNCFLRMQKRKDKAMKMVRSQMEGKTSENNREQQKS